MLNVARPARSNENPFANANCGKRLARNGENLIASRRGGRQSICNPFAVASSSSHSTSSNRTNNHCHCNSIQRMPFNSNSSNNSKNKNQQKSYRSIHKDYGPFLKYIENHIGIDEESVTLTKNRLGTFSSNNIGGYNNNNYSDHHKMSSTISNPDPLGQLTFSNQSSKAKTKAELDDERHEYLHTNVKNKDLTDKDKIFLLKREIDNLNGQLRGAEKAGYQRSTGSTTIDTNSSSSFMNLPLMSAFLVFGILLVTSKFLARKIRFMRTSGSLLLDESNPTIQVSRNYEYSSSNHNHGIEGFELQDHSSMQQQPPQGGLFAKIASSIDTTNNTPTYEAPSGQGASASISFI